MDRVFPKNCSQSEVFDEIRSLVTSCIDGFNVCILAYGQTGSGKTYTMEVCASGHKNRAKATTNLNTSSSRSHALLCVRVEGGNQTTNTQTKGKLYLIDLAGSENVEKSGVNGQRLKEAGFINKSLSTFSDVINAILLKKTHIPYRNSKLTHLLQDSLGK
ncbi:KIFC2_3 [Acanthosepion pharaonis]|uniref:KIFC2_3 n=1 Tax=Acanthosepion pharaonis TaxID=158019 RepID=A0A812DL81_ACAPH|nr:KIFC2_3 [Sepia pharaonis]